LGVSIIKMGKCMQLNNLEHKEFIKPLEFIERVKRG
jgi:hypothetical protein